MDVVAPRITTDRSVDTHSLASIVADVCREGMSDEQKAIALYEYTRRVMFHYMERSERLDEHFDLDALRLINTYGYSFCTQQMIVLVALWQAAGLESKIWGMPGHGTAQAFYGGKHHWFDPLIGAYVRSRRDGTVASLAEIAEDPTVLTEAAAEGRACPTFVPCGRVFYEDVARLVPSMTDYIRECVELGDDIGFIAARAGDAVPKWDPRHVLYQPDWRLRAGERVAFLWRNLPGEFNCIRVNPAHLPPHHWCGVAADRKDQLNWPYWRPYARRINGVLTCRSHANGRHVYAPKFRDEWFKRGFEANTFRWLGWKRGLPRLRPRKLGRRAAIVYKMSTPHVYTNAAIEARFRRAAEDDASRLLVSTDGGASWAKVWEGSGVGAVRARVNVPDRVRGMRDFWVRAECSTRTDADRAGLDGLKIEAVFQHNMFARPFLAPGRNAVSVRVGNPDVLRDVDFAVTWVWKQDRRTRKHTEHIAASPHAWVIPVAGREMPRMVRLEMKVSR